MNIPSPQQRRAHQERAKRQAASINQHFPAAKQQTPGLDKVLETLSLGLPEPLLKRMQQQSPDNPWQTPLGLQFLPQPQELHQQAGDTTDPIDDALFSPVFGVVHRHPDRVLLTPTFICPVYCRFCFRRAQVGPRPTGAMALNQQQLHAALGYIAQHRAIWEVILTGGDPLMLPPKRVGAIVQALAGIAHVGALRLHTRVPLLAPQRINQSMLQALQSRLPCTLCVHVNHADEFSTRGEAALARLHQQGVMLLGQSVLLRGVNDDAQALTNLFRKQVQHQIKPYYLHHCDQAKGVAHFRVSIAQGLTLMQQLRKNLSGVCLPNYVLDVPHGGGKVSLESSALLRGQPGQPWRIRDFDGQEHVLPPDVSG